MISKLLANRLKCCLDKCISHEEYAFVKGRSIEVIHALKRMTIGRKGDLAWNFDIRETYDKENGGFLRVC